MGPFEAELEWSEEGIAGTYRFLKRVWNLFLETATVNTGSPDHAFGKELRFELARMVKKVTEDIDGFQFNTAVAAMMEFLNFISANRDRASSAPAEWRKAQKDFLLVLAPAAPFITEDLWHRLGFGEEGESIHTETWPGYHPEDLILDTIEIVVQVKGKIRDRIMVPAEATREQMERAALAGEKIQEYLKGAPPKRIIVVPGKLVNIIN